MTLASAGRIVRVGVLQSVERLALVDWRHETLYPLTAAMEVAWFTPWYQALIPATGRLSPGRTAIGLFLVMVIPVYAWRLFDRLHLKPQVRRALLAVLLVLSFILAMRVFLYAGQEYQGFDWLAESIKDVLNLYEIIPDWLVIVLSTLFLWWRGISLGQRRPSVKAVSFSFFVGIVSFIGFVLIVSLVTSQDPSVFVPVFFFFSLMALAATRMEELRGLRGAIRSPFGFSWLISIALAAFMVVFLGASLSVLLTGADMGVVLHWIEPLLLGLGLLLGLVLVMLRTAVNLILEFARSLGLAATSKPLSDLVEGLDDLIPEDYGAAIQTPAGVGSLLGVIRLGLLIGIVVGLGILVIWMIRGQNQPGRGRDEEDHESMLTPALFLENLRQLVDAGRAGLGSVLSLVGRSGLRGLFAALTIRRIYAHMLRLAAFQGYPRAAHQTPYEFEDTAVRAFPDALVEVHAITEAYVAVHYGQVPETDADLREIQACWERLKESLPASGARL